MSDLIRQRGAIAANAARQQGNAQAYLWGNVINTVGTTMADLAKIQADEPTRKLRQAQTERLQREERRAFEQDEIGRQTAGMTTPQKMEIASGYGRDDLSQQYETDAMKTEAARLGLEEVKAKRLTSAAEAAGNMIRLIGVTDPAKRQPLWANARAQYGKAFDLTPEDLSLIPESVPTDPAVLNQYLDATMSTQEKLAAAAVATKELRESSRDDEAYTKYLATFVASAKTPEEVEAIKALADTRGKSLLFKTAFGTQTSIPDMVDRATRMLAAGRPETATKGLQPKDVLVNGKATIATFNPADGTWTDQQGQRIAGEVRPIPPASAGGAGSDALAEAGEVTAKRPDPKSANIIDRKTGLTPNAIYQNGITYALKGTMPTLGMGGKGIVTTARMAIQNTGAALADAAGTDIATLQAEYKANASTLANLLPKYNTLAAYADTANANLGLALEQSAKVGRAGAPAANRFVQWVQKGAGTSGLPDLSAFEVAIYSAAREYAKVTSGAFLSASELSTTAAKKADELINTAQNPEQFAAVAQMMQKDMDNVTGPWLNRINTVSGTIAGFLKVVHEKPDFGSVTGDAPGPTSAPPGSKGGVWSNNPFAAATPNTQPPSAPSMRALAGSATLPAPGKGAPAPSPATGQSSDPMASQVQALLKGQSPGTRYTLSDGSVWDLRTDGTVVRVK
ncbi:MAG: hypothetical protein NTY02_09240 [Acidobacteria bacterium]|nr:hypothetical protein [Acidobacteriota bacterium]